MGLIIYAQKCSITLTPPQAAEIDAAFPRVQRAAGVPESQMDSLAADLRKDANAPCDEVQANFSRWHRDGIALASSIS